MNNPSDPGSVGPDIAELQAAWLSFERLTNLRPLRTDADHRDALKLLDAIWNAVHEKPSHPLSSLFDLLGEMISEYEKKRYPMPESEPHEMLAFLIEQGERTAEDFHGIMDQVELDAVLAGRRKIDGDLAGKLASLFGVPATVFLKSATINA
ncbi:helix-turn-helix domain-containing protein [Duganella vulcania]|uniref:Transcriptional regulator n=1 Tax=Duganella vulcania TaxID=2692166 RepID=A0A845GMV6_9BURK|nr:hypothetical protein [Duganella vulcania]MYM94666.1 hypothetical protein [Duganella vulcania]